MRKFFSLIICVSANQITFGELTSISGKLPEHGEGVKGNFTVKNIAFQGLVFDKSADVRYGRIAVEYKSLPRQ